MKTLLTALALTASVAASAQTNAGGISADMLKQFAAKSQSQTQAQRALGNAIQNNSIDLIAKGSAQLSAVPSQFSIETKPLSITDQKSSGRCWSFSGLNVLRNNYALTHEGCQIVFSHAYVFFYDQLEKANLMLQSCIDTGKKDFMDPEVQFLFKNPLSDGGTFCGVIDVVDKYGLVPKSVMPETFTAENTSRMSRLMSSKLREYGLKLRDMVSKKASASAIAKEKTAMLSQIYDMMTLAYGVPPTSFKYAHCDASGKAVGEEKEYTPKSFAQECGAGKLDGEYLLVMNDPRFPYHKVYEVQYNRHTYDGHNWRYLNLPMEEVEQLAIASLKDGRKMYSSYDVGKFLDRTRGYNSIQNFDYESLFQTQFTMDKADRVRTYDSGSSHAMTLTAVNLDAQGKPTHWKVENSWGAASGQAGCVVMTDEWFCEYMFRLCVERKYATPEQLEQYKQKPTMLSYDDALFMDE